MQHWIGWKIYEVSNTNLQGQLTKNTKFQTRFGTQNRSKIASELLLRIDECKMLPKCSKNAPKMLPRCIPRRFSTQNWSKMIPRRFQDAPKVLPRWSQGVQDAPKIVPRWCQDASTVSNMPQDCPKVLPRCSQGLQDAPKMLPKLILAPQNCHKMIPKPFRAFQDTQNSQNQLKTVPKYS